MKSILQSIAVSGHQSYIDAFTHDVTSGLNYPQPSLNTGTVDGMLSYMEQLDSAFSTSGVYNQSWAPGPSVINANTDYQRYLINQLQVSYLQTDFCSLASWQDVQNDCGTVTAYSPTQCVNGAQLETLFGQQMGNLSAFSVGNYTSSLPHKLRHGAKLVNAFYQTSPTKPVPGPVPPGFTRKSLSVPIGALLLTAGVALTNLGGGAATVTAIVAGTAAALPAALVIGGTCLIIIGAATAIYMGYRLWTQFYPTGASLWQNNTDLVPSQYLQHIQSFPPIFPPLQAANQWP